MSMRLVLLIPVIFLLVSCSEEYYDSELKEIINNNSLNGDPSIAKELPSIDEKKAQLGMALFFTKSLSINKDTACVTCHHPALGGGDNLSLSIGVDAINSDLLGEGRLHSSSAVNYDGFVPVPRNAPTTFNIGLWEKSMFWDSRIEKVYSSNNYLGIRTPDVNLGEIDIKAGANLVAAQARFPITSHEEMKGFSHSFNNTELREYLFDRLNDSNHPDYIENTWKEEFNKVYGNNSFSFMNIMDAISEYERSQIFVNNRWKKYVQGNKNILTLNEKRGAKLFFSSYEKGGYNCASCHKGDFFTDEKTHVLATLQVGHGKGNPNNDDFGRFNETKNINDKYAFRTPSLLNVEVTGPWGHSGSYTNLEDIVAHMINPEESSLNFDFNKLSTLVKTNNTLANSKFSLEQLKHNRIKGISTHKSKSLIEKDIKDITSFLKTLTDPCVKNRSCLDKWIPKQNQDFDNLQLKAINKDLDFL